MQRIVRQADGCRSGETIERPRARSLTRLWIVACSATLSLALVATGSNLGSPQSDSTPLDASLERGSTPTVESDAAVESAPDKRTRQSVRSVHTEVIVRHHLQLARDAWQSGDHAGCVAQTNWVLLRDPSNEQARSLRALVHAAHRYPQRTLYEELIQSGRSVRAPAAPVVGPVQLPALTAPVPRGDATEVSR